MNVGIFIIMTIDIINSSCSNIQKLKVNKIKLSSTQFNGKLQILILTFYRLVNWRTSSLYSLKFFVLNSSILQITILKV